jgi:hypothetical protein
LIDAEGRIVSDKIISADILNNAKAIVNPVLLSVTDNASHILCNHDYVSVAIDSF